MDIRIDEIAPEVFRITTYLAPADLQFSHFLVRDEEPLLFHTGLRAFFPAVYKGVGRLLDPSTLRWIGFSHFEADECGSLDDWLSRASEARPLCGDLCAALNIDDVAARKARPLCDGEILNTGRLRFRYLATPHLPHGWDSGLLYEETEGTLFCSDLFLHKGRVEAFTTRDIVGRARQSLLDFEASAFAHPFPWTPRTSALFRRLADLAPRRLALMHGSSFSGDCAGALLSLEKVFSETAGERS